MRLTLAPLTNFDIGIVAAAAIAFAAYRVRALSGGGALAAWAVGAATFGGLGTPGAAILLAFFVSSVALSRWRGTEKRTKLVDIGKTGGARDAAQVLANGGVAAACAIAALFDPRFAVAFAAAFAAATADTWGTEVGTLARRRPRSILTLRPIATGLSGGVSLPGSVAEIAGALLIAAVAFAAGIHAFAPIAAGGVAGALCDSVLGASAQALRWCPQCKRPCETEPHICGANTTPLRGIPAFGNDAVNFCATLAAASIGLALAR
jgi:uncharacterized protein (TIGR00297 family)